MKMQHIAVSSSPYQVIRDLKIRGRRMSTTAVMTEGGDWKEFGVARREKSLRDQVEGADGIVYIFSISIIKYFSHGFL